MNRQRIIEQRTAKQWDAMIAYQQAQVDLARAIRYHGLFSIEAVEAFQDVKKMRRILNQLKK